MRAKLRREGFEANAKPALLQANLLDHYRFNALFDALDNDGVDMQTANGSTEALQVLAQKGFVEFSVAENALTIVPLREDFSLLPRDSGLDAGHWKLSKFQYLHFENGAMVARNPKADCYLKIHDARIAEMIAVFAEPAPVSDALEQSGLNNRGGDILHALVQAGIILPCDAEGRTEDDVEPDLRMWDFHELLFHSRSRLGRSGYKIGATWELQEEIPKPPLLKENRWSEGAIPLYRPQQLSSDLPLFSAMESRRSVRDYNPVPLSAEQLGEFLFRTMRMRGVVDHGDIQIAPRPYPNGGGIYEQELYVTIDACLNIPRGFYYYDAVGHQLCLVKEPCPDMEALIDEAVTATGNTGRPQILFTIGSRFGNFNWKYSGMSYAAQLKNVGVIYQTMYLVATAMGIGACGLGLGNSDRFAALTGLDYATEGSIGEFMIGRPR